jgi:hypothetical protein
MVGDFVIQVRPDVDPEHGVFQGRVEHMDSGRSARFRTVDELIVFITQRLQQSPQDLTKT